MALDPSDVTLADLDAQYPKRQLDDEKTNRLKEMAVRFTNDIVGGHIARLPEVEGSEPDFAVLVWAHRVALREGEPSSQSQSGGSVSYARRPGDIMSNLTETRFGREARGYLRNEQSIGFVKGDSHFR